MACCLCLGLAGQCRRAPAGAARPIRLPGALQPIVRFQPPPDGLLTEAGLDRYVRVRRASKGRSDEEAARAVGVDPEEFAWVRARVVEATVALEGKRIRAASEETFARTLAALRQTRASVKEKETLRSIDEQIAGLERERASLRRPESLPVSVAANAKRVAARRAELDSVSP